MPRKFPGEQPEPGDESWKEDLNLDFEANKFAEEGFKKFLSTREITEASREIQAETYMQYLSTLYWAQEKAREYETYMRALDSNENKLQIQPFLNSKDPKTGQPELLIELYYISDHEIPGADMLLRVEHSKGKTRYNYFLPGVSLSSIAQKFKAQILSSSIQLGLFENYIEHVKNLTDEYAYPQIIEVENRIKKILEQQ